MSAEDFSASEISADDFGASELITEWEDLNFTESNVSRVHMRICPMYLSRSALLQTMCTLSVFIFVFGLTANSLVVWASLRSVRRPCHGLHLYILNLAVADLCVVATLPVWVSSLAQGGHWPFGQAACKLTHLLFSVNLFASIFFLVCMSVDRYLFVVRLGHTCGQWERPVRCVVCVGVWLIALIASVPDAYFLQSVKSSHGNISSCRPVYPDNNPLGWMAGIQLSFVVLGFAVPFPIIAISYALLASALATSASSSPNREEDSSVSKKILLTYIVVFLACWAPYHSILLADAMAMLGVFPLSCAGENALFTALHLTHTLSLLHCCVNPVVYSLAYRQYRHDLMKAFMFKYSTHTGLAHLTEGSQGTETEETVTENHPEL
ncbi:atypical chemokine receptor 3a [Brachyhypopomus gauderio]|uniref:atypical chemokine receptor 3a n=1 Tax=Brachyhypopomus gauderio TaxID=698409 RepID=UPI00404364F4